MGRKPNRKTVEEAAAKAGLTVLTDEQFQAALVADSWREYVRGLAKTADYPQDSETIVMTHRGDVVPLKATPEVQPNGILTAVVELPLVQVEDLPPPPCGEYRKVDTKFKTSEQKTRFKRLIMALERQGATTLDGKPINERRPSQVFRWIMEQI